MSTNQKLYILANARVPSKKAYAIQLAKMCEAFVETGTTVELVIPGTHASRELPLKSYYQLRADVPVQTVSALDWYSSGKIPFILGSLVYMISSMWYLWTQRMRNIRGMVYVVDMDSFSYLSCVFSPYPYTIEIDRMPATALHSVALRRARGVVCINREVRSDLLEATHLPPERVIDSPNGVDPSWFDGPSKLEARQQLGIPKDERFALFVGRFWDYKGIHVLAKAAAYLDNARLYVVGGTREEFMKALKVDAIPDSMHVAGECKHHEVPLWLAAADSLIVVGSRGNVLSARYFSPMKVYEYMAADRPIIAAEVPAIRAILPEDMGLWYEPDDAEDLAVKITQMLTHIDKYQHVAHAAQDEARQHTWAMRAKQVTEFMLRRP